MIRPPSPPEKNGILKEKSSNPRKWINKREGEGGGPRGLGSVEKRKTAIFLNGLRVKD